MSETEPDAQSGRRRRVQVLGGHHPHRPKEDATARRAHPRGRPRPARARTLAALQGGLLLAQIQRDTKPLEAALDAMIALIASQSGEAV